jgi:hypothetical protein
MKTSDGAICARCVSISASYATQSTDTIKGYWDTNRARWSVFEATQTLKSFASDCITIDDTHRFFILGDIKKAKVEPIVFSFDEVDSYEFETVGGKTVTKKKGGITRAIVGGAIAGPVGAVIGSGTAKEETKTTGGIKMVKIHFTTHAGKVERMSRNYPLGFTDFLDRCIDEAKGASAGQATAPAASAADEILKYKALLDQGIITDDEFQAKKTQLLGL